MTNKALFHINVPLDDLRTAQQMLSTLDIDLDPVTNMLHLPQDNLLYSIFTGRDGQYAVDQLNDYLCETDRPKRIPHFNTMPPETRRELLEFATLHVEWTSDCEPNIGDLDSNALQKFLETIPDLLETAV